MNTAKPAGVSIWPAATSAEVATRFVGMGSGGPATLTSRVYRLLPSTPYTTSVGETAKSVSVVDRLAVPRYVNASELKSTEKMSFAESLTRA